MTKTRLRPDFQLVFEELRALLKEHEPQLEVQSNTDGQYYLNTGVVQNNKPTFFGAVQRGKSYVSFHLMPVYLFPELLERVSNELRSRMQGRSCFNFRKVEPNLFKELGKLTKSGYERFRKAGLA